MCACCVLTQTDERQVYLRDVKVPLKRFCDYFKDKKWVAGDTVRLTIVTCTSCAVAHCTYILLCFPLHAPVRDMHILCILQLTYVDFRFYEILDKLRVFEPALLEGYPVLKVNLSLAFCVSSAFQLCYVLLLHAGLSGPL